MALYLLGGKQEESESAMHPDWPHSTPIVDPTVIELALRRELENHG